MSRAILRRVFDGGSSAPCPGFRRPRAPFRLWASNVRSSVGRSPPPPRRADERPAGMSRPFSSSSVPALPGDYFDSPRVVVVERRSERE
jgi:hypothetical protein